MEGGIERVSEWEIERNEDWFYFYFLEKFFFCCLLSTLFAHQMSVPDPFYVAAFFSSLNLSLSILFLSNRYTYSISNRNIQTDKEKCVCVYIRKFNLNVFFWAMICMKCLKKKEKFLISRFSCHIKAWTFFFLLSLSVPSLQSSVLFFGVEGKKSFHFSCPWMNGESFINDCSFNFDEFAEFFSKSFFSHFFWKIMKHDFFFPVHM